MSATNSLDPVRVDSKASLGHAWLAAADAAWMPARQTNDTSGGRSVSSGPLAVPLSSAETTSVPSRLWWRRAVHFVRNAVIGLSLVAAVPFTVVAVRGDGLWRMLGGDVETVRTRIDQVERLRVLTVARDASITPMAAGLLFHALHPVKAQKGLAVHPVSATPVLVWDQLPMSEDLFTPLRLKGDGGLAKEVVTAAAREIGRASCRERVCMLV